MVTNGHENETDNNEIEQEVNLDEGKFNIMDIATLLEAIEIAYKRDVYSNMEVNSIQPSFDKARSFLTQFTDKGEDTHSNAEEETRNNTEE